jgi:excisionase family DNA binding protein
MAALGDWMTTQEAAELAEYHPNHIRRLVRAGEVNAQRWGNALMISRKSLLAYLSKVKSRGERRGPKTEK